MDNLYGDHNRSDVLRLPGNFDRGVYPHILEVTERA